MKKTLIACFIFSWLIAVPIAATAHNPFTSKPEKSHKTVVAPAKGKFLLKITFWQHQLREKMSGLIREAKTQKKVGPILLLSMFAFLYGVIHSAGPGHGKAVALSYILSCKPSLKQSLFFGNLVALIHGCSGIAFVLMVKFILELSINKSLEEMTYITQMISFSLISLMGSAIFIKGLSGWLKSRPAAVDYTSRLFTHPTLTAAAVGIVPCPGVVMVMLFSISMNLTILGIFLGGFIAAGMAFTITTIVLVAMSGKAAAIKLSSGKSKLQHHITNSIETLAGLFIAAMGCILLLATI